MALPVINIDSKLDGKGFKQAETALNKLSKSTKKLAAVFGIALSARAITQFGKASVKAFAEDEAAAAKLTRTVNNLGLGFENARITQFISDLEKSASVSDDVLRPAFNALLTTTGSVANSQKMLALALDVAAGSGEDVATVAGDLAAAYVGNTKGLAKYRLGLTKAELAGKSFNEIQSLLNAQFSGQNSSRLETYAGKMSVLGVAAGNAQEIIGKGLVDAISKLGDDDSIQNLADDMEKVAERTANVIRGIGVLVAKIKTIPGFNSDFGVLYDISYLALLEKLGKATTKPKPFTTPMTVSGSTDAQIKIEKARAKAEADAAKRAKELLALQKKAALVEKNKLSLSKAAAEFDTNRISIAAALKATYDKETRLRLEALMAIEDEDGDKALDRIEQLGLLTKAKQTDKLNGIKGITDTELLGLNTTLMTELGKIEATKNARIKAIEASGATQEAKDAAILKAIDDADKAQAAAFAKYNDALAKQGGLNDLSFYSQKTQISTLEIMRLASIETTLSAQITADQIALKAGLTANSVLTTAKLNSIATVAAAQAAANASTLAAVTASSNAISGIAYADPEGLFPDIGGMLYSDAGVVNSASSNNITVNVNAGVIGSEETVVNAVQEAILTLNRQGSSLFVAGTA